VSVKFAPGEPLGLDLTEVRQSAPNGGSKVAIKRVRPGAVITPVLVTNPLIKLLPVPSSPNTRHETPQ